MMCISKIVRRKTTFLFFTVLLASNGFSVFNHAAQAAPPTPPTQLQYAIYSNTAAELFWSRASDDGSVRAYEVLLNGSIVETRDATSYFTDSLVPQQFYTATIIAIDNDGERSLPASLSFTAGDRSTPTIPDSTIDSPSGLTAEVYSRKSAELFWDRPDTFGLNYEVKRDGELVALTNGVSYYDNTLVSDTQYSYSVTAINQVGTRSTPTDISLRTLSGAPTNQPQPPELEDPVAGDLAAPTGLIASVYSKKSAELFWDRPETFGLVYEVSRDGEVLQTTNGVSFYDNTLLPNTQYSYQVTAISLLNERSVPTSVRLKTFSDGSSQPDQPDTPLASDITEPDDLFDRDGYSPVDVLRVDLKTVIGTGPCNADDESGCTLDDVLADTDKFDDHTVDINVHFQADDFANDGSVSNATLRLRGGGSRFADQKSFRIKLDSKQALWRGERHLQLNKHPFDLRRVRNKIAMDVMSVIPHLPSLRTQFVNLWIDDGEGPVDYGLFTHVERVNEYFLRKRNWHDEGNIYKAEYFRFTKSDLDNLQLDENGEPIDEDLFERTLEIENGEDHRTLVEMLNALHDPARSYDSVLEQYFDRDNVLAWMAANILLRQNDSVRHNFILYNPTGTEKFYFIPWDYDAAVGAWSEPPNDLSNDSLRQRLEYGYALAARNPFLENFYRQPGVHQELISAVQNLRQNYVTDEYMSEKINHFVGLVAPYQYREPDSVFNPDFSEYAVRKIIDIPGRNADALATRFNVLMAPILREPELAGSHWQFSWSPAFDVTSSAGSVSYRLQIATTPTFVSDSIYVDIGAIEDSTDLVKQNVHVDQLPTGEYFARLIATPANEPERNWQVSGNKLYYNNEVYYGALYFEISQ